MQIILAKKYKNWTVSTMDMDVETGALAEIKGNVDSAARMLIGAAGQLSSEVINAGQNLEGRQYSLSVAETQQAEKVVEGACENMYRLSKHLDNLSKLVAEYLKCKYKG